jgi:glycosyltransferase involved in cell wall biosynthesis
MKNILWLPAWYPNKTEPLSGDFIQRHARAVSIYCKVHVVFVVKDEKGTITKNSYEENFQSGNLHETIIYYYSPAYKIPLVSKLFSAWKYRKIYKQAVNVYLHSNGKPIFSHIHIADRNGSVGLWLKKKYDVPFILSEHWTIYLPEAKPNFSQTSFFFKLRWKNIIKHARAVTVVSKHLGNAMKEIKKEINFSVIPNVVDEKIFYPVEMMNEKSVHFIHISNLTYQKNFEDIVKAFALVKKTFSSFRVSVFGPERNELKKLVNESGLSENIFFMGEVPQPELAAFLQKTEALILYSRYETFGCVLIEANACGMPAIVSDIPVFHEIINEGENGFFAPGENAEALSKKITWFIEHRGEFSKKKIADNAKEKYNYEKVGKMFSDLYNVLMRD